MYTPRAATAALAEYTAGTMFFFAALTFAGALLSPQPQQQTSYDGNSIADCLKHVRQHDLGQGIVDEESFVEPLARAKIVQAAPDIEALFAQSKDDEERAELASVLVRLSVKDDLYWNTLVSYAQPALDNDFPDSYDMATADDPKPQFTPAFLTKAKEHGMSTEQAFQYVYFFLPNDLTYLAKSGDPRGIPLLRKVCHPHCPSSARSQRTGWRNARTLTLSR